MRFTGKYKKSAVIIMAHFVLFSFALACDAAHSTETQFLSPITQSDHPNDLQRLISLLQNTYAQAYRKNSDPKVYLNDPMVKELERALVRLLYPEPADQRRILEFELPATRGILLGQKPIRPVPSPAHLNSGIEDLTSRETDLAQKGHAFTTAGKLNHMTLAAGASSRYFKEWNTAFELITKFDIRHMDDLWVQIGRQIEEENKLLTGPELQAAIEKGLEPYKSAFAYLENDKLIEQPFLQNLFDVDQRTLDLGIVEKIALIMGPHGLNYAQLPKALVAGGKNPHTGEGLLFLELKILEAFYLNPDGQLTLIIQKSAEENFEKELSRITRKFKIPRNFIHLDYQYESTNSIRVRQKDGAMAVEVAGGIAFDNTQAPIIGPSGHGAIIHTINNMARNPQVKGEAILITNIDNLLGDNDDKVRQQQVVIGRYSELLNSLETYRQFSDEEILAHLLEIRNFFEHTLEAVPDNFEYHDLDTMEPAQKVENIRRLAQKPLTVAGMVPITKIDKGGGPAYIEHNGRKIKAFFEGNIEGGTYFSPVFFVKEIRRGDTPIENPVESEFYLVADKVNKGVATYHFETILWELIGNSINNHLVYVGIKTREQGLFNPSKGQSDAIDSNRNLAALGFDVNHFPEQPGVRENITLQSH